MTGSDRSGFTGNLPGKKSTATMIFLKESLVSVKYHLETSRRVDGFGVGWGGEGGGCARRETFDLGGAGVPTRVGGADYHCAVVGASVKYTVTIKESRSTNCSFQFSFLLVHRLESDAVTDLSPGICSHVRLNRSKDNYNIPIPSIPVICIIFLVKAFMMGIDEALIFKQNQCRVASVCQAKIRKVRLSSDAEGPIARDDTSLLGLSGLRERRDYYWGCARHDGGCHQPIMRHSVFMAWDSRLPPAPACSLPHRLFASALILKLPLLLLKRTLPAKSDSVFTLSVFPPRSAKSQRRLFIMDSDPLIFVLLPEISELPM
ncbi:hypothetical protein J6590_017346 [Homalodisca vitripennis]|nr:hypothetical protein J6590_017346 [Homalodisca vitripennis]